MRLLHTVAFTRTFLSQAHDEGMGESEMEALVRTLSSKPDTGDLIVGSGGCRKLRIARVGGGKSGGFRVVIYFARRDMPVYAIAVLAKNARATFSSEEIRMMKRLASRLLSVHPPSISK